MDIESEKFGFFLKDIRSHETTRSHIKIFGNEFSMLVLPKDVRLPCSEFTGLQANVTVVVSKHTPPTVSTYIKDLCTYLSMCCAPLGSGGVGLTWGIWSYPRSNSPWWRRILSSNPPVNRVFFSLNIKTRCTTIQGYVQGKVKSPSLGPKFQESKFPRMSQGRGWGNTYNSGNTELSNHENSFDPQPSISSGFPLEAVQIVCVGQPIMQNQVHLPSSHPKTEKPPTNQINSEPVADISTLTPLTLDKARYIASLYSISTKTSSSLPNLWILCSNEKPNIVSLGTSFINSTLYIYTITLQETLHSDSSRKDVCKQQNHFDGPVFSRYAIAGSSSSDDDESGSLSIEFNWSEAERPLSLPPESAHAVIKVSAKPGYTFSPVLSTYSELSTLLAFCNILSGASEWPLQEHPSQQDTTAQLTQKIDSFLSDVASPLTQVLDTTVISPTADNTIYETRKNLDFAERLWMFAKDVTSLDELQETFGDVFKALLLGRVQPFVHRTSSSTLAILLRQLLQCSSTEERQALAPRYQSLLSPTKLLPCLIQIGLEKMRRDYRTFFISSDIVTDDQLDDFFSSSFSQSQLAQCHILCKLHCVLEINASLLSFLNLPSSVLSSLTKTALQVYRGMPFKKSFSTTPTFSLPLAPYSPSLKSLVCLCTKLHPTTWKATRSKEQAIILYRNEPLYGKGEDSDCYSVYKARFDISCLW